MTTYDDHLTSCPGCTHGLEPEDLCDHGHESGPRCLRCCTIEHKSSGPTLHVYEQMEQRSPEWYAARCGIVTASVVGKLITADSPDATTVACPTCGAAVDSPCLSMSKKTPAAIKTIHDARAAEVSGLPSVYKVADNDTSRGITASLVAERITGDVEPTFTSDDMFRGIVHEPLARDAYSGHREQAIECGFMRLDSDIWSIGYSPDGLVGDDGLIEIKCPRAKTHVLTILADDVPAFHMAQLQTGLLVSGRKWIDYVSFCAGLPLYVKRVYPDPAWHAAITAAAATFETTATEMVANYNARTEGLPLTDPVSDEIGLVF